MTKEKFKDLLYSFLFVTTGFLIIVLINSLSCLFADGFNFNIFKRIFTLDAFWYKSIIDNGYMRYALGDPKNIVAVPGGVDGMANWAFFPLLPFVIKLFQTITFKLISIEILSFIFSFMCYVFMIYNIIQYLKDKNININYILLFLIFVYSSVMMLFFSLYTETLTMLLIILLIRSCDKKKYFTGGVLCGLLSMIKVQGCFWCIYLFIKIYQECITKGKNIFSTFFLTIKEIIKKPVYFLSLCISPLGLFIFFMTLNYFDLSILSFMHVQSGWGKENGFFLVTIIEAIFISNPLEGLMALFFFVFTFYLLYKKKYLSFFMMILYIVSSTTSSVASVSRYILGSVIFPLEMYLFLSNSILQIKENSHKLKNVLIMTAFYVYKGVLVTGALISFFAFNTTLFY